jgi:ABC-type microcin C transport system duplicated ATPase subunit YejF
MFAGSKMVRAVKGVDFAVERGKTLAIVGRKRLGQVDPGADHRADRRAVGWAC